LKCENLLVTENFRIKVCDFGFSRPNPKKALMIASAGKDEQEREEEEEDAKRLSFCGTDSHMAPEIILGYDFFDAKVDIFSYGVILCELGARRNASSNIPPGSQEEGYLKRQIPGFGVSEEEVRRECVQDGCVSDEFVDVALNCVKEEPEERCGWKEILKSLKCIERKVRDQDLLSYELHVGLYHGSSESYSSLAQSRSLASLGGASSLSSSVGGLSSQGSLVEGSTQTVNGKALFYLDFIRDLCDSFNIMLYPTICGLQLYQHPYNIYPFPPPSPKKNTSTRTVIVPNQYPKAALP
jgi:serine/threonine protein kinase